MAILDQNWYYCVKYHIPYSMKTESADFMEIDIMIFLNLRHCQFVIFIICKSPES
jgi:hypothetical protein